MRVKRLERAMKDFADLVLPPDTCPVCGFHPRSLTPNDGIRTIRSLPRRWREVLTGFQQVDERSEQLLREPLGNGPSALGHAVLVADVLGRTADELEQLWIHDRPALDVAVPSSRAGDLESRTASVDAVLDSLSEQAERFVARAERFNGTDWLRTGTRGQQEVTALAVLRRAVHEGTHRLRETERGLIRLHADGTHQSARSEPDRPGPPDSDLIG